MSDRVELSMALPLDSEGFLRRKCPTCEREFKWLPAQEGEVAAPVPDGGYFCPYCGVQAPPDGWFTQAQVDLAQKTIAAQIVDPMMKKFADDIAHIGRRSGGLVSARVEHRPSPPPEPLTEDDDMTRVDFVCHPNEPVKVLDVWDVSVHCLVCGAPGGRSA